MSSLLAEVDLTATIERVLSTGRFILGPELERFEAAFAEYCGTRDCVGVANGTDALELALRALGVGPGQQVAIVANAGPYGATAVYATGATPRYVDVDPVTLDMDPAQLEQAIADGIAAVIVTHLFGQLADMDAISSLASAAGIPLVEDCAQAHGARRGNHRAGAMGAIGCFSFYPTKNLGAVGDGGAVVTDDAGLAARVRRLRAYGWSEKYKVTLSGGRNSRLDELQAAVLSARLPYLDAWNRRRRLIADRYIEQLSRLPVRPVSQGGEGDVSHLFVVLVDDRDDLAESLREASIGTDVHYPVPDHLQPGRGPQPALPVTEAACRSVLTLPCHPGLTERDVGMVITAVRSHYGHSGA